MKAELKLQLNAQPGLSELEALFAALEQSLSDAPHLRLKVLDLLFTLSDGSLKPGFVELVAIPAFGTDGQSVIELQVTDRLRELVGALAAGDVEVLGIDSRQVRPPGLRLWKFEITTDAPDTYNA